VRWAKFAVSFCRDTMLERRERGEHDDDDGGSSG
jgi:hypothetical protein